MVDNKYYKILEKYEKLLSGKLNEQKEEDVKAKIIAYLKDNPAPKDEKIHKLGEKMGIEADDFESKVYAILGSFIGAGRAKEKKVEKKDVDSTQLKMGIKVEMEHTSDPVIAERIALDHLAEIPDYYTRLKKMEEEAGIKG